MNKFYIFTVIFLSTLILKSQDIIVNFYASGDATEIDHVKIENISKGTSITTTNSFINLSTYTGIDINQISLKKTNAFPNPFINSTQIEIFSIKQQNAKVFVTDMSGKKIISEKFCLNSGSNSLKFNAPEQGIYILTIASDDFVTSQKLICSSTSSKNATLDFSATNKSQKNISELFYEIGDLLLFTAYSEDYSSIITASPTSSVDLNFEFYQCTDFNNNSYSAIRIGNQIWMGQNLKSSNYSNGNSVAGAYSYNNNSANDDIYGKLYTWDAVMNGVDGNNNNPSGVQGVCPNGWHVPSEIEWDELRDYLGGWELMGGKLKETGTEHWVAPNSDATNETGMNILPAGIRFDDGDYQYIGEQAFFWNTTDDASELDPDHASGYTFFSETPSASYYMYTWNLKAMAQSVRCVKD